MHNTTLSQPLPRRTTAASPLPSSHALKQVHHTLCCQLTCNFEQRDLKSPSRMARLRFEGVALSSNTPRGSSPIRHTGELTPLFAYSCGSNGTNRALAPSGILAPPGCCSLTCSLTLACARSAFTYKACIVAVKWSHTGMSIPA